MTFSPAALETLLAHFRETNRGPEDYDLIITGDLGSVGSNVLCDLMKKEGFSLQDKHRDCGCMIYNMNTQDVHAGGSGCGCIASTLCGHILPEMKKGNLSRILAIGTGALLSTTSGLQGETVPGIAHLVVISTEKE